MDIDSRMELKMNGEDIYVKVFGHSWYYNYEWFNDAQDIHETLIKDVDKLIEIMGIKNNTVLMDGLYEKIINEIDKLFTENADAINIMIDKNKCKLYNLSYNHFKSDMH